MKSAADDFDPTCTTLKMRDAKRYAEAIGATWRISGRNELIFEHRLSGRHCVVKANRGTSNQKLMTWLRHLYAARAELRRAFGYDQ